MQRFELRTFCLQSKRSDQLSYIGVLLKGATQESNLGPLAPKARIIPLDQWPKKGVKGVPLKK